jgi:hypothetical protein
LFEKLRNLELISETLDVTVDYFFREVFYATHTRQV